MRRGAGKGMKEPLQRMRELVSELNTHSYRYYTEDNPTISDKEYDALYDELTRLEQETGESLSDSPTRRIGGAILKGFEPHRHLARLWSLDKAQNQEHLAAWAARVQKLINDYNARNPDNPLPAPEYVVELKFDGLTLNLTYADGELVQAATRGTGEVGEGILAQVRTIRSVPLSIGFGDGTIEVQGEGIMRLSVLQAYNETAAEPLKTRPQRRGGRAAQPRPQSDRIAQAGCLFLQRRLRERHLFRQSSRNARVFERQPLQREPIRGVLRFY